VPARRRPRNNVATTSLRRLTTASASKGESVPTRRRPRNTGVTMAVHLIEAGASLPLGVTTAATLVHGVMVAVHLIEAGASLPLGVTTTVHLIEAGASLPLGVTTAATPVLGVMVIVVRMVIRTDAIDEVPSNDAVGLSNCTMFLIISQILQQERRSVQIINLVDHFWFCCCFVAIN